MFNLLVMANGWNDRRDEVSLGRIYFSDDQKALFKPEGVLNLAALKSLPAIFAEETNRDNPHQVARVGQITDARIIGQSVSIEYLYDPNVPPIPQSELVALAPALGIHIPRRGFGPFEHSHWAVMESDLFKVLMTEWRRQTRKPSAFYLEDQQHVQADLLSAMMPFSGFDPVWSAIKSATEANGMRWDRADNRWDHPAIIQDVVALIDQAAIVVCDCSGKNPNVFYEMGIAHSFGKEVIIITQNAADIPFDIAHLRHIRYHPNTEGLQQLEHDLSAKIRAIRMK